MFARMFREQPTAVRAEKTFSRNVLRIIGPFRDMRSEIDMMLLFCIVFIHVSLRISRVFCTFCIFFRLNQFQSAKSRWKKHPLYLIF